jgi:ketosteroid isomerase-like protein
LVKSYHWIQQRDTGILSPVEARVPLALVAGANPMSFTHPSMAGTGRFSPAVPSPEPEAAAGHVTAPKDPEITGLIQRATRAHAALMQGDLARYRAEIVIADDFTLMAPFGGKPTRGAAFSDRRWAEVARFFRNGRDASLDLIEAYRSEDIVVLVAFERVHVEVGGLPAQHWSLRVTLVFRKDREQWLLVHRHADPLVAGISIDEAARLASPPQAV